MTLSTGARALLGTLTSAGPRASQAILGQAVFTCPKVRRCLPEKASAGESLQLVLRKQITRVPWEGRGSPRRGEGDSATRTALSGRAPASRTVVALPGAFPPPLRV